MRKYWVLSIVILLAAKGGYAHEPLYGLGPETLPKHMNAIEFGTTLMQGITGWDLGYGYGITQNWTVRADIPTLVKGNSFGLGNVRLRTKYALWRKTQPGVLKRLTAIAVVSFPTADKSLGLAPNLTATTLGLANGYESRRWYYFSDVGYTYLSSASGLQPGGKFKYNLVGGIRPVKTDYLKPDLVLLIELNGELSGKSRINNSELPQTGGNTLSVAPGFLLSYRNIMLKGGIQLGIANTKNVAKPAANGLVSLEYHF